MSQKDFCDDANESYNLCIKLIHWNSSEELIQIFRFMKVV